MSSQAFHVAIDGPVAAGKGTVSKKIAEKLGFLYIDTGAMYRMTGLLAKEHQVKLDQEEALVKLVDQVKMSMHAPTKDEQDGRTSTVLLNDHDVSWEIRTEEMSQAASIVAQLPKVREILVKKQQEIAQGQNIIMEGRDITYRVLPQADLKIFLTANQFVRAKRRYNQQQQQEPIVSFAQIEKQIKERDERDFNRSADPLRITADAWVIDTSDLSVEKICNLIVSKIEALRFHS